jgi:hypothetical protein
LTPWLPFLGYESNLSFVSKYGGQTSSLIHLADLLFLALVMQVLGKDLQKKKLKNAMRQRFTN